MDKKTGIVIGAMIVIFAVLAGITIAQRKPDDYTDNYKFSYDYTSFDANKQIGANEANGNFGEIISGNPDAPVKLIEYGNYQCSACAPMNPKINALIDEYDGKLAVIFRYTELPDHKNGKAAAKAALAAHNQGYWEEYKDLLYANQDEWFYSNNSQRKQQFEDYFMKVSDGKGDLERFREDVKSEDIAKKIAFDDKMSTKANVQFTPYFVLDGKNISQTDSRGDEFLDKLREAINKKLKDLEK